MKKIEKIIDNCIDCRFSDRYTHKDSNRKPARICMFEKPYRLAGFDGPKHEFKIPDWCPLETYSDAEREGEADTAVPHTEAAPCYIGQSKSEEKARDTIIVPGLPHIEWMPYNLSGLGGTKIDGRWYYTYDEALEAVNQLGDGWRLPTRGELLELCNLGSTWDDDRQGRWFGGNHDTDRAGSLFLPASGYRERGSGASTNVGSGGYYWSTSPAGSGSSSAGYLDFYAAGAGPLNSNNRAYGFSVRCVRNRQK